MPIKRFVECLLPVTACNLKCSYCYVIQKSNPNSPEVLTSDDMNRITEIKRSYLVARKFDFCVDSSIVKIIKKEDSRV